MKLASCLSYSTISGIVIHKLIIQLGGPKFLPVWPQDAAFLGWRNGVFADQQATDAGDFSEEVFVFGRWRVATVCRVRLKTAAHHHP